MGCTARYAEVDDYVAFWNLHYDISDPRNADTVRKTEMQLDMSAAEIHMALSQVGACDCSLATWATELLKRVNCMLTGLSNSTSCIPLTDSDRADNMEFWAEQADRFLTQVRTGELEICAGFSAKEYPAFGWAEQAWTPQNAADIIVNRIERNS